MRSPLYEQALTKLGAAFDYVEKVPLEDIDMSKGLRNQARLDNPQDEELIEQYAMLDKAGSEAPPVVLWRPGKGRWIPVDGNQRLAAKVRNNRKFTDAYCLRVQDQKLADEITWLFNNRVNGRRISYEECMEHAVSFVRKYGVTAREAADKWGVNRNTLAGRVTLENGKDVLAKNGVKIPAGIPEDHISRLLPLGQLGEDIFCAAAQAVFKVGARQEDLIELVRDVKRAATSEAKLKVVETFVQSPAALERAVETHGGTVKASRTNIKAEFTKALTRAHHLYEDYHKDGVRPYQSEYKKARVIARELIEYLYQVFDFGALPKEIQEEQQKEVG